MASKIKRLLIYLSIQSLLSELSCVFGYLDIEELKTVNYGIDILGKPVTLEQNEPPGAVYLHSKFGQQYQCSFPDHSQQEKLKEAEERIAVEIGIPELLRPLETGPCLIKIKDWWTYEFCYGKHIRQYHQEDGKITGNILYLGLFESEYDWNSKEVSTKHKSHLNRYHSQQYINGSKCDLTQEPRKTEVRFVCEEGSGDYISRIDEPETCVYILTVHTTKICHHPNLKPAMKTQNVPILCNPVISNDEYEQYLIDLEEERKKTEAEELEKKLSEVTDDTELEETEESILEKMFSPPGKPKSPGAELQELMDKVMQQKVTGSLEKVDSLSGEEELVSERNENLDIKGDIDGDMENDFDDDSPENGGMTAEYLQKALKSIITEKDDEVGEDGALKGEKDEAIKTLSQTLGKLLDKQAKTEKDLDDIDKDIAEASQNTENEEILNSENAPLKGTNEGLKDERVKVRITRLKTEGDIPGDDNEKTPQKQVIETTIENELKKAGLDTDGGKIRVKIITAAYYDSDDNSVHVLSEEDSAAFNKMIGAILGGNQEAAKEAERQKQLEDNYHLVWNKKNQKSKIP